MNIMKKVSIIIPAYNAEKYLWDCLNSVCGQTYSNLEIIVIDDGSKDKTREVIEMASQKDNRIKKYYNINHGVSYSRNFGLDSCTGEYVSFVDADDIIASDFVQILVENIENMDTDMAAIGVEKNSEFHNNIFTNGETVVFTEADILKQLFIGYEGFVCNKLYKRKLLQIWNIRLKQDIAVCEDLLFNVEYLLKCKKVSYYCGKKYFYRQYENSATYRLDNERWFDTIDSYQYILNLLDKESDVYDIALNRYAIFLCSAKYRIQFIKNEHIEQQVASEWSRIRPIWGKFSKKQRLKLYIFEIFPGIVLWYQRRKLKHS